jgi:hypothetical protein
MDSKILEVTKLEVRQKAQRDSSSKLFYETYSALNDTLRETYPECKELTMSNSPDLVYMWNEEMEPHTSKVKRQDHSIMIANLKVLNNMKIPQLWIDGKFTNNSKRYIWMYIENLCKFAAGAVDNVNPNVTSKERDIRPPSHIPSNSMPGIQQIYDELPKNMLNKVRDIAERYSADIEDGKTSVSDIKFDVISKELFSQIDPEEMQQMVTSVGSMLQGAMQNGDGEMGELFKMFSKNDKTNEMD